MSKWKCENKNTCGECKHMSVDCLYCKNHLSTLASRDQVSPFCEDWEPKTNGDKIRQMSNAELAKLIVPKVMFCDGCPVKCAEKDIPQIKDNPFGADIIDDVCTNRVETWLNAPEESEVNNARAQGIIIEDRGLYKMMAFEESYIDLKNPISIEQRNISPAEDAKDKEIENLKAALKQITEIANRRGHLTVATWQKEAWYELAKIAKESLSNAPDTNVGTMARLKEACDD